MIRQIKLKGKVYRNRSGDAELRQGDIHELVDEIPPHDLLTAGFPCQPFSTAGKKKGVRAPRGDLFEVIVDVLHRHQPKFFILENVKRLVITLIHALCFPKLNKYERYY